MTRSFAARAALGAGTVALGLGIGLTACSPESSTPLPPSAPITPRSTAVTTPTPEAAPAESGTPPEPETVYRDGAYSATGWYGSLPSHHDVTLTVDDDIVTAVEITTPAEDETSLGYQQRFAAALPGAIVGRGVDEIAVDRLAGSSGCSEGFMDALAQIKEQASA